MTDGSNEQLDRIEANVDRVTALLVETAERQRVSDHEIAQLKAAIALDAENIRALARIAEAH
jgi:hypothetical protein